MAAEYQPHIKFMVGKPLRLDSITAEVIQRLHRDLPMVTVCKPLPGHQLPSLVFDCDFHCPAKAPYRRARCWYSSGIGGSSLRQLRACHTSLQ